MSLPSHHEGCVRQYNYNDLIRVKLVSKLFHIIKQNVPQICDTRDLIYDILLNYDPLIIVKENY